VIASRQGSSRAGRWIARRKSIEVTMTVNDIAHILVEGEGINTLYLADGRIARVSTLSGKVMSVVRLPTEEALQDSERKSTARRSRAVIAGSHYDVD
jgi:hypothetical protein